MWVSIKLTEVKVHNDKRYSFPRSYKWEAFSKVQLNFWKARSKDCSEIPELNVGKHSSNRSTKIICVNFGMVMWTLAIKGQWHITWNVFWIWSNVPSSCKSFIWILGAIVPNSDIWCLWFYALWSSASDQI